MEKRGIIVGDYDTAADGWTLAALEFPEPDPVTNFVDVPGRIGGPLNLSYLLTDGEPIYGSRTLTATLEMSERTREDREDVIGELVSTYHGEKTEIILPDYPGMYVVGLCTIQTLYSDPAHASIQISATCEPWLYDAGERSIQLTADSVKRQKTISLYSPMPVVPTIEVQADSGDSVSLTYGDSAISLSAGTYSWPDLRLTMGKHTIYYTGTGTITVRYREGYLR